MNYVTKYYFDLIKEYGYTITSIDILDEDEPESLYLDFTKEQKSDKDLVIALDIYLEYGSFDKEILELELPEAYKCIEKRLSDISIREARLIGPYNAGISISLNGWEERSISLVTKRTIDDMLKYHYEYEFIELTVENFKSAIKIQTGFTSYYSEILPELAKIFSQINEKIIPSLMKYKFSEVCNSLINDEIEGEDSNMIMYYENNSLFSNVWISINLVSMNSYISLYPGKVVSLDYILGLSSVEFECELLRSIFKGYGIVSVDAVEELLGKTEYDNCCIQSLITLFKVLTGDAKDTEFDNIDVLSLPEQFVDIYLHLSGMEK